MSNLQNGSHAMVFEMLVNSFSIPISRVGNLNIRLADYRRDIAEQIVIVNGADADSC
jgi:hypothetical protein